MTKSFFLVKYYLFFTLLAIFNLSAAPSKNLYFYNWSDYIAPDTIPNFERQTGIIVNYDVFDSNEILDSKLMAGNIGFDLVLPSDIFFSRQLNSNIYQPINKKKLGNYKYLDKKFLKFAQIYDPNNRYGIPYMWQTTGIGINVTKVRQILGQDTSLNSWDLLFKIENIKKLSQCGVAFLDAPSEIYPTVLKYLGKDPNKATKTDYLQANELLLSIRPYITYFHSSKYINDLASGEICIAIAWSGDVFQAARAAKNANKNFKIDYIVPKEGALISFDILAIPKEAKNIDETYQFLNYLLDPKVIANISNYIFFPNINKKSIAYLHQEVINNKAIYPPKETMKRLFAITELSPEVERYTSRLWTKILTGY